MSSSKCVTSASKRALQSLPIKVSAGRDSFIYAIMDIIHHDPFAKKAGEMGDANERSQKMTGAIEVGSTNVYADLGYADAQEMQRKSSLASEIARCIKAKRLTQDAAAELLGIDQAKISKITRGLFRGVSETKMGF